MRIEAKQMRIPQGVFPEVCASNYKKEDASLELTHEQKQTLYDQGFVKLPGIVPKELVHDALRAINASLGSEGIDPARLSTFRSQSYCPEVTTTPAIVHLLNASPLWSIAESAIGSEAIQSVQNGQIALRFPVLGEAAHASPHLDGMYSPIMACLQGQSKTLRPSSASS